MSPANESERVELQRQRQRRAQQRDLADQAMDLYQQALRTYRGLEARVREAEVIRTTTTTR